MQLSTADHIEIQQLYARYAHAVDGLDSAEDFVACWTEDGEHRLYFRAPDFPRGHDALRERSEAVRAARTRPTYHWNAQVLLTPSPEVATGVSYQLGVLETGASADLTAPTVYHDDRVEADGRWLFRRRALGPRGWDPDAS